MFTLAGDGLPKVIATNPGMGTLLDYNHDALEVPFKETIDLVGILADYLKTRGRQIEVGGDWLKDTESGYFLLPQIMMIQPQPDAYLTGTTIQINHDVVAQAGIFEFQYAIGANISESIQEGYRQWYESDYLPLLDVVSTSPACVTIERQDTDRRVILGQLLLLGLADDEAPRAENFAPCSQSEFCNCCLYTKLMDSFDDIFHMKGLSCLRVLVGRGAEGEPIADCRLNGEEYPQGKAVLLSYAAQIPGTAPGTLKQYVVMHNTRS